MAPELEQHLWDAIPCNWFDKSARKTRRIEGRLPRDVIKEMLDAGLIQSPKQAWRTLEKWCDKGWYNYGVTLDLGWREVRELAASRLEQPPVVYGQE